MNAGCRIFIIQHSSFIIFFVYPRIATHEINIHADGHRRLFALPRGHRQEDQVLLQRFSARVAEDRPHDGGRAAPGLLEARQPSAGAGAGRDRACLLATRCELLQATDQSTAARAAAAKFLAKHPNNQVALAESAIVAGTTDARKAFDLIQRAMRAAGGALAGRTYQAMGLVAGACCTPVFRCPPGAPGTASRHFRGEGPAHHGTAGRDEPGERHPVVVAQRSAAGGLSAGRGVEKPLR